MTSRRRALARNAPIHTDQDLLRRWQDLMGPLGFSHPSLWLAFLDANGRMATALTQIEELPPEAGSTDCRPLIEMCRHVVGARDGGLSVAILLTRPGRHPMTEADRGWARGLTAAAQEEDLRMWPVHFANDRELVPFAPDDLLPRRIAG